MKKGKEKRRKITLKKGEKALNMHLFGVITLKNLSAGVKRLISKEREGEKNDRIARYTSLDLSIQ